MSLPLPLPMPPPMPLPLTSFRDLLFSFCFQCFQLWNTQSFLLSFQRHSDSELTVFSILLSFSPRVSWSSSVFVLLKFYSIFGVFWACFFGSARNFLVGPNHLVTILFGPHSISHVFLPAIWLHWYLWVVADTLFNILYPLDLFFFAILSLVGTKTVSASFDDSTVVQLDYSSPPSLYGKLKINNFFYIIVLIFLICI